MNTRIISFCAGATLGLVAMLLVFHVFADLRTNWGIVVPVSIVLGLLASVFGKKFWEFLLNIWP